MSILLFLFGMMMIGVSFIFIVAVILATLISDTDELDKISWVLTIMIGCGMLIFGIQCSRLAFLM